MSNSESGEPVVMQEQNAVMWIICRATRAPISVKQEILINPNEDFSHSLFNFFLCLLFPYDIQALDHQLILGRAVTILVDATALLALRPRSSIPAQPRTLSPSSPAGWEHWSAAQPLPCPAVGPAGLDSDLLIDVLFRPWNCPLLRASRCTVSKPDYCH